MPRRSTSSPVTSGRGRARCRSLWNTARSGTSAACWPCCAPCCTGAISPPPAGEPERRAAVDQLPPPRRAAATGEQRAGRRICPAALAGEAASRPDGQDAEQVLRLESERKLVQIVTIHKSKGLEYPLVFLPFICSHRAADTPLFHEADGAGNRTVLDLTGAEESLAEADRERLAEDLRLLYVALTGASTPPGWDWRRCAPAMANRRRPTCTRPPSATCCKRARRGCHHPGDRADRAGAGAARSGRR